MPYKQKPCPTCDQMMDGRSEQCRSCKPSYQRTNAHRQKMSAVLIGQPKPWLKGRKRQKHSRLMKKWWTQTRRKAASHQRSKPSSLYFGLSGRKRAALVQSVGHCERCSHDGSES